MNIARIRQLLAYSPSDGAFFWLKNRRGNPAPRAGDRAGGTRPDGYRFIGIDGKRHYEHRLAWLLVYGPIPEGMEIDHIDHNPSNNRISNLRLVTKSGNRHNRARDSRNKSGINGVHWSPHAKAWCAQIRHGRKTKHLGYFKRLEDAAIARKKAEAVLGFHANHGVQK